MPVTTVTLLHYNDIYNIESRVVEPVGGAARSRKPHQASSLPWDNSVLQVQNSNSQV
jgi:hypothetical protein